MSLNEKVIEEMVLEIVGDHMGKPAPTITLEDHISNDLGADSLDQMELIMTIEELFNIKIPDRDIANIKCVRDIVMATEKALPSTSHLVQARQAWKMVSGNKLRV